MLIILTYEEKGSSEKFCLESFCGFRLTVRLLCSFAHSFNGFLSKFCICCRCFIFSQRNMINQNSLKLCLVGEKEDRKEGQKVKSTFIMVKTLSVWQHHITRSKRSNNKRHNKNESKLEEKQLRLESEWFGYWWFQYKTRIEIPLLTALEPQFPHVKHQNSPVANVICQVF